MDTSNYFSTRRTIRKYDSSRRVSIGLIDKMLEDAARAATTGNMQTYSVVVSTAPEEIAR
ncbi:MAG: nitroreductase family protein, partial [Duncaniella sp.]|nr:nitroreductase family protein [Duncaniella sp.]